MPLIKTTDKVFVAGHKGMAGSSIIRSLKKYNYQNILTCTRKEVDLTDTNQVSNWFEKNSPNVVVLAAAKVGGIYANKTYPNEFLMENLKIQSNVIENSFKNGVNRLLFLGSSCIYPKYCDQPIKEDYLLTGSLESTNEAYALAKITGIKQCSFLRKQYDFDAISLMPTNLYGPNDNYHPENSHVLPALIRRFSEAKLNNAPFVICWGSGSPLREFLHVDDLGDAAVFALMEWDPNQKASPKDDQGRLLDYLNVGSGKDISIFDLAHLVANEIGYQGEINWDKEKPDGTPKKQLDVSRLNSLGWSAKISLRDGIRETIEQYEREFNERSLRV